MPKAKKKVGTPPSVGKAAKEADVLVTYLKQRADAETDVRIKKKMLADANKIAAARDTIVGTCKNSRTLNVWGS